MLEVRDLSWVRFRGPDLDYRMAGYDHLAQQELGTHHAGIGRHILGSQIPDYWKDRFGQVLEHSADGDLPVAGEEPGQVGPEIVFGPFRDTFQP